MLVDLERKLLRIIENYTVTRGVLPTYRQLSKFTGKSEGEIKRILSKLIKEGYLEIEKRTASGRIQVRTHPWSPSRQP